MAEQVTTTADGQALPLWLDELRPGGTGEGFIEKRLRHALMFVRRPVRRLLVTFDNLSNVGDTSLAREPWAFKFARDTGISHLGVMARVSDWYRDPELIARMQGMAGSGFFDGYDRVVFAGVSMGGFASIAFGSLVPGAHAVSVNPQSTLDTDLVPWETRYENGRRQDWTLPLSDAAALTRGFGRINIFYDPYHALDQKHIDRLSGDNVRLFKCRHSNHKTAVFMRKIDILKPVMHHAIFDELTEPEFYRLYRRRRDLPWFCNSLAGHFTQSRREKTAARVTELFRERLRRKAREKTGAARRDDGLDTPGEGTAAGPALDLPVAERQQPATVAGQASGKTAASAETPGGPGKAPAGRAGTTSPRPVGERGNARCGIVTTMKNEAPFMLEWVAYNRAIGFTDFLIYTNHCDDGTDAIAVRLEELGIARHVDNVFKPGASPQRVALRRARASDLYLESDWVICADCDEFLNIRAGEGRLPDLFEAVGEADAISLCWKTFGCGDQVEYHDRFITENFTWSAPEDFREKHRGLGLKTLFRPSQAIRKIGVHRPKFEGRPKGFVWKDSGGQPMPEKYFESGWSAYPDFSTAHARLHHYAVRSVDSFLVKRDRGRTNHIDRDQGVAYWCDMNLSMEQDTSLLRTVERTREEFARLIADPVLGRLHAEACAWHRARIRALKEHEEWRDLHALLQTINRPGEYPVNRDQLLQDLAAE